MSHQETAPPPARSRSWEIGQSIVLGCILILALLSVALTSINTSEQKSCNSEIADALLVRDAINNQVNSINSSESQAISQFVLGIVPYLGQGDTGPEVKALFDEYAAKATKLEKDRTENPIPNVNCDD